MKTIRLFVMLVGLLVGVVAPLHAQRPDAPAYALWGSYAVGTQELLVEEAERPLKITIWYPSDNHAGQEEKNTYRDGLVVVEGRAIQAAPPSEDAPFPLVIFSHGSGGTRWQSMFLTEHLASQGFVVMAPDHPGNTIVDAISNPEDFGQNMLVNFALRPLDVLRVLDYAETLNDDALPGLIDLEHVAVMGHSFGGYTTLAVVGGQLDLAALGRWCDQGEIDLPACQANDLPRQIAALRGVEAPADSVMPPTHDARIDSFVLLAPASGSLFAAPSVAEVTIPGLIVVGTQDTATPANLNAEVTYQQLPNVSMVLLENAGHYIFVDACSELAVAFGLYERCSDPVWDMQRAHDLVNHVMTAFLRAHLQGDTAAGVALQEMDFVGLVSQSK